MTRTNASIAAHFGGLPDPRRDRGRNHLLIEIIILAIVAVIGGANDWVHVELFCQAKEEWFRTVLHLKLPHGIPSHDTFGRVFSLLAPDAFQRCFVNWVRAMVELKVGEVVTLDGKVLRGSFDRFWGKDAVTLVNVWASAAGLALAVRDVPAGTNEISVVPQVLQQLVLTGCIVTMDAAHCHADNTRLITEQRGEYVLALKANQGRLYAEVEQAFTAEQPRAFRGVRHETYTTQEKSHGRVETRRHILLTDPQYLDYFNRDGRWWSLAGVGLVERTREQNGQVEHETHYFITSLSGDVKQFAHAVRAHWEVENQLHYVLDVVFREDASRVRTERASENFGLLRQMALNLLRREDTPKLSLTSKRLKAGWDNDFLLKVIAGAVP
jgi:predicted transposase YbfD/YdcC